MEKLTGKHVSVIMATPSQSRSTRQFECPLCVDVFQQFSHLQKHLLSMHPRREMIMKLVMERYGNSEKCGETPTSPTLDCQHAQEPSTCFTQTASMLQPVVMGMGATMETFKIPLQPSIRAAAVRQNKTNQCERRCKEFAFRREVSPSEDSSS